MIKSCMNDDNQEFNLGEMVYIDCDVAPGYGIITEIEKEQDTTFCHIDIKYDKYLQLDTGRKAFVCASVLEKAADVCAEKTNELLDKISKYKKLMKEINKINKELK